MDQPSPGVVGARTGPPRWHARAADIDAALVADTAMPGVTDTPDHIARRKEVIYRATFQEVTRGGDLTEGERDMLARLSDELGLSATSVRALERDLGRGS